MKKNKWIVLRGLGRGHGHWGTFLKKMETAFPNDRFYWLEILKNYKPSSSLIGQKPFGQVIKVFL